MPPLYHILDPFWKRFPWPGKPALRTDEFARGAHGAVTRVRMAMRYLGSEVMPVYCYAIGDTLVDSGMPHAARQVVGFARETGVRRVVLTHHHEDHAGGAAAFVEAGTPVHAPPLTARILKHELPIPWYQHLAWGRTRPVEVQPIAGDTVAIGPYEAAIVAAPGHAIDQVVFHVAEEGWLFAGDLFIHERVKVFRADEDYHASVASLERVLKLDFDVLFCGHRPVAEGGKAALGRKLDWLRKLEDGTRRFHGEGCDVDEIVRRLKIQSRGAFVVMAAGDASPACLVRSILDGPKPRLEMRRFLASEED